LDIKRRFSEEQIIGFLAEAEGGLPIKELCRLHGFSEPIVGITQWLVLAT
jgi:putative transposase